jgi:hypothetical protein
MAAVTGFPSQPTPMDTFHMRLPDANLQANNNSLLLAKRTKFKLEPMKVLEPSNKKLSLPESQRIMFILEEVIRQIEILDYIEVITNNDEKCKNLIRADLNDDERKKNFDQIFVTMCQNHRTLIDAYKKVKLNNSTDGFAKNKETLEMLIKSSCKDILRVLLTKPNLFENFRKDFHRSKPNHPKINELLSKFC